MHTYDLILTLTGGLAGALVAGYVTQRLGLSPIVGYLLAGVVVGPYTPGFVAEPRARRAARRGRRHPADVRRRPAVPPRGAAGRAARRHPGRDRAERRGDRCSGSPSAVRCGWELVGRRRLRPGALGRQHRRARPRAGRQRQPAHARRPHRRRLAGRRGPVHGRWSWCCCRRSLGRHGRRRSASAPRRSRCCKVGVLVAFTVVRGRPRHPLAARRTSRATRSRELFTLTVLVLALGIAVGSAELFGVSMALGAFLAGMVVGRSDFSLRAASEALPMRDAFAVLFFVSVGMLLDPAQILARPWPHRPRRWRIVVVGKPLAAFAIVALFRYPTRVALSVAAALGADRRVLVHRRDPGLRAWRDDRGGPRRHRRRRRSSRSRSTRSSSGQSPRSSGCCVAGSSRRKW